MFDMAMSAFPEEGKKTCNLMIDIPSIKDGNNRKPFFIFISAVDIHGNCKHAGFSLQILITAAKSQMKRLC